MTKVKLFICAALIALVCSSCHSIYSIESLYDNYNSRMRSEEELEIKGKVIIYFTENEIHSNYSIISVNTYKPFCLLPFNSIFTKKMNKKFLSQAVKKAYEEGGNAILVRAGGFYYVLNLENWNADDAPAASFVNPIYETKYSDIVASGALDTMKRSERIRTEKAFMDEIEANISNVKDTNEINAIRAKVKTLSDYNYKLKHPKNSIEKKVKKYSKKLNWAEKFIIRTEKKKQNKEAKNNK